MENITECQAMIWISGTPLSEKDWKENGHTTLQSYIDSLLDVDMRHLQQSERDAIKLLPYVSFGTFNSKTGAKDQILVCKSPEELPTETVDSLIIFD